ncbi:hypothetical protein FZ934_12740 [Rhizobium grahamii]|uniref:Uncharacterized protein n=1 Tax=Rhizobium grahamii TaxID=1120045 RepID=A0A5Q0CBT5_9HYPH|nr:hypothetical protein FZ934_12740 [Rhizobium grahamii]
MSGPCFSPGKLARPVLNGPPLKDWIGSQLGPAYSDEPVMAIPYDRGDGRDSVLFDYVWLYPRL